ncbi:MAG: B12-binding domain-containing radical SAM protein [Spirochaetota bacterium]
MKILLIKPPLNPNLISTTLYEPLELEYLAAAASRHHTEILDMRIEKDLQKKLHSFRPDLAGITSYTCDVKTVKKILKEVKNFSSTIITAVGGNHATFMPGDFTEDYIDTIFMGYADHSFPEYIDALAGGRQTAGIPNIAFSVQGELHFNPTRPAPVDLDSLPFPARHLTEKYHKKYHDSLLNRISLVMTSRGCPFRCTFCACWKLMQGKYVTRDVSSVVRELKSLPEDSRIVYFSDDNTVHNIRRAWELSENIKKEKINKKIQMYARADLIVRNPELFQSLKEAGLEYLTVGFESINDSELDNLNKKTTVAINNHAIAILKKLGIYINAHFIIDPGYTENDFKHLLQYLEDKALFRPAFPVLTPLPGTELYQQTQNRLAVQDYDFFDFAHSVLPTRLDRREFYKQLAGLYNKSYSIRRFIRFWRNKKKYRKNTDRFYASNTDGISIWMVLILRMFALPYFLKLKRAYKTEPLAE